jgi:HNH endonuclease
MAEVWKPVPSIPGLLASSEGRVLLPPCYAPLPNGGYRLYETKPIVGAVTSATKTASHTYRGLYWKKHGNIKVHQAVCEAFHGPKPFPAAVVIHLDEDAHNNRPENLKWGTQKENLNMPKFKEWLRSEARNDNIRRKRAKAS